MTNPKPFINNCNSHPRKRNILVISVMALGTIYYLILPVILSDYYYSKNFPLAKLISGYSDQLDKISYFSILALYFIFFILGFTSLRTKRHAYTHTKNSGIVFYALISLLVIFQFYSYYALRSYSFKGYAGINWDETNSAKSFLSGLNIIYTTLAVFFYTSSQMKNSRIILLLLLANSVFLLGLGGRMFVLPAVLAFLYIAFLSTRNIILSKKMILIFMAVPAIASTILLIGLLRQGDDINSDGLSFILLAEVFFTWIGAGSFIQYNSLPYFAFPKELITSILAMIPSVIWPSKLEFISKFSSGYYYDNPVGATSIVYVMLANFGVVGSAFACFILGAILKFLSNGSTKNALRMSYFISILSLMPFMFFRSNSTLFLNCALSQAVIIPSALLIISNKIENLLKAPKGRSLRALRSLDH